MPATLRIRVRDVYGDPLSDRGDIEIDRHPSGLRVGGRRDRRLGSTFTFEAEPLEVYAISVYPNHHRPVRRFVRAPASGTRRVELVCPIHPARVAEVSFPSWDQLPEELQEVLSRSVLEGSPLDPAEAERGPKLYDSLDAIRRAGLLNIHAKANATVLPTGLTVWSYLTGLYRVRGDRVFADVGIELRDAVKDAAAAGQFTEVSSSLHTPPPGFAHAGSFKTRDRSGNLQLTFFASIEAPLRFKADIDIDNAQGAAHLFDVIHHFVTDGETHPYDIQQILVASQEIDPGYVLTA